jgi:hypothetical protein
MTSAAAAAAPEHVPSGADIDARIQQAIEQAELLTRRM